MSDVWVRQAGLELIGDDMELRNDDCDVGRGQQSSWILCAQPPYPAVCAGSLMQPPACNMAAYESHALMFD